MITDSSGAVRVDETNTGNGRGGDLVARMMPTAAKGIWWHRGRGDVG